MTGLDRDYSITDGQISFFRENGFARLKNVFAPEDLACRGTEITGLTLALNKEERPLAERSTYGKAFLQITNLWEHGGAARELVFSSTLGRIATQLLEIEGVRLYHDQSLYKEPGGGLTPAHADQFYWPLASDRSVTAWIPLQAVPAEMGPIGFYAGSHRFEYGRNLPISDESERLIAAEMKRSGFPLVEDAFELGEVSFHLGWTFHRAGPNRTTMPRSVMTIIYMDKDMRLAAPSNRNQQLDWETWCPGTEAGEVIATPKNPLIWKASGAYSFECQPRNAAAMPARAMPPKIAATLRRSPRRHRS